MILLYTHQHYGPNFLALGLTVLIICLPGFLFGIYKCVKDKISFMNMDIGFISFISTIFFIAMVVVFMTAGIYKFISQLLI